MRAASEVAGDLQDRLASVLGCPPERRSALVAAMIHRGIEETTGYWLQLIIAAGIATLGLVLGSTAVIIGAMLVAPLMGPIVALGMGLAAGSPILVLRSVARVGISVLLVVAIATGLTWILPFHQLTAEISSRTTPTAIDLATAMFCAIAGVYAAMRPGSDVTTTAAGTSIGISLVPPLCASGFGVGTESWAIAWSAMLLFLTNFSAIVLVGSVAFALAGFARVDVRSLEDREFEASAGGALARPVTRRAITRLRSLGGPVLRLLMPVALLAALFSPLRAGLDLVAWQVGARAVVDGAIGKLPQRVVQARVRVERREIDIVIFMLGSLAEADQAKARLTEEIAASAGVQPHVNVHAVADANEFEALDRANDKLNAPMIAAPPPTPPPPPTPAQRLDDARDLVQSAVSKYWPSSAGGQLLDVTITTMALDFRLDVLHLGKPLDPAALEVLQAAITDDLGEEVVIVDEAIPATTQPLTGRTAAELLQLSALVQRPRNLDELALCLVVPPKPKLKPKGNAADDTLAGLVELASTHPRAALTLGEKATLTFVLGDCNSPP
ncbi:MAG: DUF389 domain-containing protein [Myxococcales bacterium]|nr:DUF389 domain-containing protein [Myxococcales bacterium]